MRRLLVVLVIGMMAFAAAGTSVPALAQATPAPEADATPAPMASAAPGVTVTVLGDTEPEDITQHVMLVRVELAPGADTGDQDPPGTGILYVESGTVTYRLVSGAAVVLRAGEKGPGEPLTAGEDAWVELSVGDRVVEQTGAEHVYGNRGDQPAVLLISGLYVDGGHIRCASGCWSA
jgi:quercetin dioxygenase-like cupin family protein